MAQQNKVQLLDVPYTDDWNAYSFNMSINNALTSLQNQIDALSNRIDKEGVITGGDDTTGWYAKFPDGKVLQGKYFASTKVNYITWVFPIEFLATDAYCVSCTPENWSYPSICQCLERSKSSAKFKVHSNDGQSELGSAYHVMAFGRWK